MKNHLTLIVLLFSFMASAQNVGGFYTGVLHNDSTGTTQQYELAIAAYKGKITGYSYVTFVEKDRYYWGIRRVEAEIIGDSLVVKDGKFVEHNFPEPPAKKVGRVITIPLHGQDSVVTLMGNWKTNQTRLYYSVPGSIELHKSADSTQSPLIRHLKELNIIPAANMAASGNTTPAPVALPAPKLFTERRNTVAATLEIESDSLALSLYDNGSVDGDTVSVYFNKSVVVQGVRLTTTATRYTVAMSNEGEVVLQLVAENLGSIPPNTGLLMIRDGNATHQVHFTADLNTNATIVLKRKKR